MKVNDQEPKNLLSGFIDVKIPPKGRKLGPWKAWKRQWCAVQKSAYNNCVELALGNNSRNVNNTISVPHCATLCRSESRTRPYAFGVFLSENKNHNPVIFLSGRSESESQQWMAHIRSLLRPHILPVLGEEFSVSLIDNSFSRSTGLFGIYGILSLSESEMIIRDPTSGEVSASWKWSKIEHNYVRESTPNSEDSEKIFAFQTSCRRGDKRGSGKLHLFCEQAAELQSAVSRYRLNRQRRLVTSPLPPTPPTPGYLGFRSTRRLSRSEGDLRWPIESSMALLNLRSRSSSRDRGSSSFIDEEDEKDINSIGKVAKSLILASASFSLLLSTPGCSDPDSLHEYQAINNCNGDDNESNEDNTSRNKSFYINKMNSSEIDINDHDSETDDLGDLFSHPYFRTCSAPCGTVGSRRVSAASVASGIYAEIDENPESTDFNTKYENLSDFTTQCSLNLYSMKPPPLPPRRTNENYMNRCPLNRISNSLEDDSAQQHEGYEQNSEQMIKDLYVDNNSSESQYIMINMKGTEENGKETIVRTTPPPLPPRRICEFIESEQTRTIMTEEINSRNNQELQKKENIVPELSEPDYMPMSQVPMKISMPDETYVVMANMINRKMSSTIAESVP